jgi:hypothetical protein
VMVILTEMLATLLGLEFRLTTLENVYRQKSCYIFVPTTRVLQESLPSMY